MSFQVGDVVRVGSQGVTNDPNGMGPGIRWVNSWVAEMDINVGITFTVKDIDEHGVWFEEQDSDNLHGGYGYPINVLEPVALTTGEQ